MNLTFRTSASRQSATAVPATPAADAVAVRARDLTKTYGTGDAAVHALRGVSLDVQRARFTAVMGPSGSGKSTLMHTLAGLEEPDRGSVTIGADRVESMNDRQLTRLRRDRVGFIFQQFNLIPTLTAEENIVLPMQLAGRRVDRLRLSTIVEAVGLGHRLGHLPAELSGGQQQRVAIARALVPAPDVVFADEPTGALDSRSGQQALALLRRSVDDFGQTVVMVTHDPRSASYADQVVFLDDGRIVSTLEEPTQDSVVAVMQSITAPASAQRQGA